MINLIFYTMERKELLKGLLSMLKDLKEKSEEHTFDANSDECKNCSSFTICKEFNGIRQSLESSKYDNEVKEDLFAFIAFVKYEYLWLEDFDVVEALKDDDFTIYEIHQRFDNLVNNFKNWDKLVELLDDNQLSLIRKIVLDINQKITDLVEKIKDNNFKEMNFILGKLNKPQQEAKRYEDMTKEELIELLNNK